MQPNFYWEKQRGGLCRLHSLNAFMNSVNGSKGYFSEQKFRELCNEFDKEHNLENTSNHSDINNNTSTLLGWIVEKETKLLPYWIHVGYYNKMIKLRNKYNAADLLSGIDCFFCFNKDHVWVLRKDKDTWYTVKSMGGIHRTEPLAHLRNPKQGCLLIIPESRYRSEVEWIFRFIKDTNVDLNSESNKYNLLIEIEEYLHLLNRMMDDSNLNKLCEVYSSNPTKVDDWIKYWTEFKKEYIDLLKIKNLESFD